MYRDEIYSLQNLLSRTQAGPGGTVKKEQEEISPNHAERINLISVLWKETKNLNEDPKRTCKLRSINEAHCTKVIIGYSMILDNGSLAKQLKFGLQRSSLQ